MFTKVLRTLELVAVVAFAVMVLLLFTRQPATKAASGGPANGAQVFAANCASCHGATGQGGVGPQLSGGRAKVLYRDAAAEVAFVKRGAGVMPAFEGRLTDAQIAAVVEFTRGL